MALTRITQGVIEPNQNYDTHNINSTGIVTATGLNISGNASIGGVLTYEDVTNIDSIGIITARSGVDVDDFLSVGSNIHLGNAGVVTATSFSGDGSGLTGLSADKIFEGNTKAEVIDTGSDGRFVVTTEGTESFSINNLGGFTFNRASDNVIEASGDITIDYKPSGSLKIRNFAKASALYFFPMSDTYPVEIGSGFTSNPIRFYRTGEATIGTGITLSGSTGNIIASGIVTASNFVGDGSSLTNILISSDAQFNTVGGTQSGDAFTGTDAGNNTLYGYGTGTRITSGDNNTHMGYNAGSYTTTNDGTTYIGARAGEDATGGNNTAVGLEALKKSTGGNNTAVGREAGNSITSGDSNVLLGGLAGNAIVGGSDNVILGYNADVGASSSNNIIIGYEATGSTSNEIVLGNSNHTKFTVTGIGLTFATSGNHISGVTTFTGEIHGNGQRLGSLSSSGRFNGLFLTDGNSYYGSNKLFVANGNGFGLDSYGGNDSWLKANSGGGTSGDCWMKTGSSSGGYVYAKGADGVELHHSGTSDKKLETVSGGVNVVGSLTVNGAALQSGIAGIDTTGTSHFNHLSVTGIATFSGTEAIFNRVSFPQSGNKTIVGNMAGGSGPTGTEITVVGYGAGYASSGNKLTAIGRMSGRSVSGTDNTCIGYEAGYSNQGAQKNVFVGKDAGMGNKTGSNNIVVGSDAGEGVWNNANYSNSVILGAEAGAILTSSNSNVIVIGYDAEPSSNSVTNEITLGNSSITNLRVPGIGVTFATSGNHISGITTFSESINLPTSNKITFGNDAHWTQYRQGDTLYIKPSNTSDNAQFNLESNNQLYLHARASGMFLRASNQSVIDIYGGYGGGIYFSNNATQYLKLEYGNWTFLNNTEVRIPDKIVHAGDTNTMIRFPVDDTFTVETAGTERFRINNTGITTFSGAVHAASFHGDGSALTGISGGGGVTSDSEENTVAGTDAGNALDADTYRNTLFGFDTGKSINSGDDNTIMGWKAGDAIDSGYKNCAVGSEALPNCNSGHNNVAMGWEAGRSLNSGNNNVMLGPMAGRTIGGGTYNIALGYHSLSNTGSPTRCIGLGGDSVFLGGTDVIGIGQGTMMRGGSQIGSIGIGRYAGRNNAGDHNVYIGYEAGHGYGSGSPYTIGNYNTGFGYQSLYDIKEGYDNVAIGASAGSNVNDGYDNVLIGVNAGLGVTTGNKNVYIGKSAGKYTHQSSQVAIGHEALMYSGNTTAGTRGNQHTAIGNQCMKNLGIYVNYNTAVGEGAMRSATSGFNAAFGQNALASGGGEINTAIGMNSLDVCNGSWNSALGYKSGDDCTSGSKNSLIGVYAGEDIVGGSHNLCLGAYSTVSASGVSNEAVIGAPAGHASVINHVRMPGIGVSFSAGGAVISGIVTATSFVGDGSALTGVGGGVSSDAQENTVGGTGAGANFSGTSARDNTLFGHNTGNDITSGDYNTCYGSSAGELLQTGHSNTCVGSDALRKGVNTMVHSNVMIGRDAGKEGTSTNKNVAIGNEAFKESTSSIECVFVGYGAGNSILSGNYNVAVGQNAGAGAYNQAGGSNNTSIGHESGKRYTTGSNNSVLGTFAGDNITSGNNNVCIGANAGDTGTNNLTTGSNNILIGHDAQATSSSVSNEVTIGDTNITTVRIPGVSASISATESVLPAANFNAGVLQETFDADSTVLNGNYNHDVLSHGMVYHTSANASGTWQFNLRGDASTTFDSLTTTNRVTTMTIYSTNNGTSTYMTQFKIDGSVQTVKWAGGSAPSASTSGVDVYSMTIMKTSSSTYHVFGNVTNFA